jgi:thiopeptide-type bacteriocin biosynthesis protein
LSRSIRRLLELDTTAAQVIGPGTPLAFAGPWFTAMTDAGRALADSARSGLLRRGLRDVLAHQILFHWNRLGLPAPTQTVLAHSAMHAVGAPQ